MKYKYFIKRKLLFFVILLLMTGCVNNSSGEDIGWEDEILLAQDCGMDGLRCCLDKNPACFYGQVCCVDPHNSERNRCVDQCACGDFGKFCCAENPQCKIGLTCLHGDCAPCGDEEEPCCDNADGAPGECNNNLICHGKKCLLCGFTGNPCCDSDLACVNQEKQDIFRTECRDGVCVLCGSDGNKSCEKDKRCLAGHLYNNGLCYRCGGYNQPCCDEILEEDNRCNKKEGLKCVLGFCNK